jgi:hypothetical protein
VRVRFIYPICSYSGCLYISGLAPCSLVCVCLYLPALSVLLRNRCPAERGVVWGVSRGPPAHASKLISCSGHGYTGSSGPSLSL